MKKLIAILLAMLLLAGCQKKGQESVSLDKHPLISYLPATTVGLAVCSKESTAGYKSYQSSELFKRMEGMDNLAWGSDLGTILSERIGQSELPKVILALRDSIFDQARAKNYKDTVLFLSPSADYKLFDIGWLANTSAPVDLTALKSTLKSQNYELKDELLDGSPGFSLALVVPDREEKFTFYFLSSPNKIAIGTNSQTLVNFIQGKSSPINSVLITGHPGYTAARSYFSSKNEELCFGYVEADSMVKAIKGDVPEAELAQIPLAWLGFSSSFKDGLRTKISFAVKDGFGEWVKGLVSGSSVSVGSLIPAGSVLSAVVDGSLISQIKTLAESRPEIQNNPAAKARLAMLGTLRGLGLNIRNSDGASLFPEILFVARTDNPAEVAHSLKESLITSFGVQGLEWHEKEINGQKVYFFITPLGIGAYLLEGDKVVMAGSTEGIVKDAINLLGAKTEQSSTSLADEVQSSALSGNGLITGLINYTELSKTLESVQSSLATFSGGSSKVDPQMLKNLQALGTTYFQIGISQGQLSVDVVQK